MERILTAYEAAGDDLSNLAAYFAGQSEKEIIDYLEYELIEEKRLVISNEGLLDNYLFQNKKKIAGIAQNIVNFCDVEKIVLPADPLADLTFKESTVVECNKTIISKLKIIFDLNTLHLYGNSRSFSQE